MMADLQFRSKDKAIRRASPLRMRQEPSSQPVRRLGGYSSNGYTTVPAAKFRPDAKMRRTRQREIVELLRERGKRGLTRLDCPIHLVLSMLARISELRKQGYKIATQRERHGRSLIARYVLLGEPNAKDPQEAGDGGG